MSQVLLLEADHLVAKNIIKVLKRAGHRVDWQVEPQAATDSADALRPDLVILDLVLAGRGGIEFLYEFRSYPEWQTVPVILYSNVAREELGDTYDELNQLGIQAYLHKPVASISELLKAVRSALAVATTA